MRSFKAPPKGIEVSIWIRLMSTDLGVPQAQRAKGVETQTRGQGHVHRHVRRVCVSVCVVRDRGTAVIAVSLSGWNDQSISHRSLDITECLVFNELPWSIPLRTQYQSYGPSVCPCLYFCVYPRSSITAISIARTRSLLYTIRYRGGFRTMDINDHGRLWPWG